MKRLLFILFTIPVFLFGQDQPYTIIRTSETINIDGILNEGSWQAKQMISQFTQYFPNDTSLANSQVEIRLAYDDQNLYVGAKMYNLGDDRKYAVASLRRDYRGNFDGLTIEIDPFQDKTNAFQFGINPYGVQREGLISNGGVRGEDLSLSWDNKWVADAKMQDGFWTVEAAIPFKTLRFKPGSSKWNMNFYRIDNEVGERSIWAKIPRNFHIISLAFMKEVVWDQPLATSGSNISIIPYVSAGSSRNFETSASGQQTFEYGGDAKIGLGSSLNLDMTINPDFSQVELDEQVTDLNRFELFFPERRQFFLENADLFESFGHPFYSRPFSQDGSALLGMNQQDKTFKIKFMEVRASVGSSTITGELGS